MGPLTFSIRLRGGIELGGCVAMTRIRARIRRRKQLWSNRIYCSRDSRPSTWEERSTDRSSMPNPKSDAPVRSETRPRKAPPAMRVLVMSGCGSRLCGGYFENEGAVSDRSASTRRCGADECQMRRSHAAMASIARVRFGSTSSVRIAEEIRPPITVRASG